MKKILLGLSKNLTVNILSLSISLVSSLFIARKLGPELTGITAASVYLVLSYSILSHVGLLNALGQYLPFLIGRKRQEDLKEANNMPGVIFSGVLFTSIISSLVICMIGLYYYYFDRKIIAIGFFSASLISFFQLIKTFYFFLLRSLKDFDRLAKFNFVFAFAPLGWMISAYLGGLVFQWSAMIISEFLICVSLIISLKKHVEINFHYKLILKYIKIGIPIFIVGFLFDFLMTSDRLFAVLKFGTTDLGYYSVASLGFSFLIIIPKTITQITYPIMAEKIAENNFNIRHFNKVLEKPFDIINFFSPLFIGIVCINIPLFIELILPQFLKSVLSAQILVYIIYFIGIGGLHANFLIVSLRTKVYSIFIIFGLLVHLIFQLILSNLGYGIFGLALSKLFAFMLMYLLIILYVDNLIRKKSERILLTIKILFPIVYVFILCFFIVPLAVQAMDVYLMSNILEYLFKTLIIVVLYAPFLFFNSSAIDTFKFYLNIIRGS